MARILASTHHPPGQQLGVGYTNQLGGQGGSRNWGWGRRVNWLVCLEQREH